MELHLFLLLNVFLFCQSSPYLETKPTIEFRQKPYYGTEKFTDDVIEYDIGDRLNFTCYGKNVPSRSEWHLMQIKGTFKAALLTDGPSSKQTHNYYMHLDSLRLNVSDDGTIIYCRVESTKNNTTYDSATSKRIRLVLKKSNSSNVNGAIKNNSQTELSPVEKEANSSKQNVIEPAYFALGFSTSLVVIVIAYFFLCRYQRSNQRQLLLPPLHPLRVTSYHQYETINEINYTELHQHRDSFNCKMSMECLPKNTNSTETVTETLKVSVTETIDIDTENSLYANEQDAIKNTFYSNGNTVFINEDLILTKTKIQRTDKS